MTLLDPVSAPEGSPESFLLELADAAIAAALPSVCVPEAVARLFQSPPAGRTLVFGAGKAAAQMAAAFEVAYPWPVEGLVVTRYGFGCATRDIRVLEAAHPVPDEASAAAGKALLDCMATATSEDRVIFLLSGGCSSLTFMPAAELDGAMARQFLSQLLRAGLPVDLMNRIRQALSQVGGGRLAAACAGELFTLAMSDVVGDRPEDIGSAPTTWPSALIEEDLDTLQRQIPDTPREISEFLRRSEPSSHPRIAAAAGAYHTIASSRHALHRAAGLAMDSDIALLVCEPDSEGDVEAVAERHAALAEAMLASGRPVLILSGGELTVRLNPHDGEPAWGGPNQLYALRMCQALQTRGLEGCVLSIDTDGVDGLGDAGGGLLSTSRYRDLGSNGVKVDEMLASNKSYKVLQAARALLLPGPTGTNVNDFRAVLCPGRAD